MTCPTCGADTQVMESRRIPHGVARRRRCKACRRLFHTGEAVVAGWLHKDKRRKRPVQRRRKTKKKHEQENWIERICQVFQFNL